MALGFSRIVFMAGVPDVLEDVEGNKFYVAVLEEGHGTETVEIPAILLPSTPDQEAVLRIALETKRLVMADGTLLPPLLDESRDPPAGYVFVRLSRVVLVGGRRNRN